MINASTIDHEEERRKKEFRIQIQAIESKMTKLKIEGTPSVLSSLSEEERTLLKKSISDKVEDDISKRYPCGIRNFEQTEKCCFEFMQNLDLVNNNFFSVDGQASRKKSEQTAFTDPVE